MATHSCQQCGKVFTGSEYLIKHITRRHPQIHGKANAVQLETAAQAIATDDIDNTVDEGARRLAELVAKAKADEVITSSCVCIQCLYRVSSECASWLLQVNGLKVKLQQLQSQLDDSAHHKLDAADDDRRRALSRKLKLRKFAKALAASCRSAMLRSAFKRMLLPAALAHMTKEPHNKVSEASANFSASCSPACLHYDPIDKPLTMQCLLDPCSFDQSRQQRLEGRM
jgi:hypothetical protein